MPLEAAVLLGLANLFLIAILWRRQSRHLWLIKNRNQATARLAKRLAVEFNTLRGEIAGANPD